MEDLICMRMSGRGGGGGAVVVVVVLFLTVVVGSGWAADAPVNECAKVVQGMTSCLPYATAKATTPTTECCTSFKSSVEDNKVCLCKFIDMVHQGSPQVNSLGIQYAKLTQLPSACSLAHVNASDCSKLVAPTASPTTTAATSNVTAADSNQGPGPKHLVYCLEALLLLLPILLWV